MGASVESEPGRERLPVSEPPVAEPATSFRCRLCGGACRGPIVAREAMFGMGHRFDYFHCLVCGVLQIAQYPADLAVYYPAHYYSISSSRAPSPLDRLLGPARRLAERGRRRLRRHRTHHELGGFDPVGALWVRLRGERPKIARLRPTGVSLDSSILEVGCGGGALLRELRDAGFKRLEGADPFTADADRDQPGFIIRRSLAEARGPYDLVLLADSFEHMPQQAEVLRDLARVCAPTGWLCVSIPVLGQAWDRYGTDWVQLDAPRHLYLHSTQSFTRLAAAAGFSVVSVVHDSAAFQFWGSEQLRRNIPLTDPRSHAVNARADLFSPGQMRAWEAEARRLNAEGTGDHATFYLRPRSGGATG